MEQVEVGVMLPGATVFDDENLNLTYKAHVRTHRETTVAYVKLIPLREIYVECVCAVVGRYLGLPIPKPIIVSVDSTYLEGIKDGQYKLAFGAEDATYPSFKRRTRDDEEAYVRLEQFKKTLDVGVFDEWIGNYDRNSGNILYDGSNDFVFIDHGVALDPALEPETIVEHNHIVDVLFAVKTEFEKFKLNREVQSTITPQYPALPYSLISEKTYGTSYLSADEVIHVVNLLEQRSKHLNSLFKNRLRIQQQELVI
ncbi:HipA family kinase [Endozoicomonas acroporae]|uniref:HipA family kinase n=1 Tax=Endozoicomonas acroporae TaxID=1701104 RepID=UPI003D7B94E8